MSALKLSRIGAIFYVLWGILHIFLGGLVLYIYFTLGTPGMLSFFGLKDAEQLPAEASKITGSLGAQHAANLAIFGTVAIIIALAGIWKNSPVAFWMNLIMVGFADVAFIFAFFIPGYIKGVEGIIGPLLFVLAALFSGAGLLTKAKKSTVDRTQ
ncbi:MAG: hypothetical protein FVQ77_16435 [Cytophagales bacterium]|nr:hypothetical protein [Cytophagales bacterium]